MDDSHNIEGCELTDSERLWINAWDEWVQLFYEATSGRRPPGLQDLESHVPLQRDLTVRGRLRLKELPRRNVAAEQTLELGVQRRQLAPGDACERIVHHAGLGLSAALEAGAGYGAHRRQQVVLGRRALADNSVSAYDFYLQSQPWGRWRVEASRQIADLRERSGYWLGQQGRIERCQRHGHRPTFQSFELLHCSWNGFVRVEGTAPAVDKSTGDAAWCCSGDERPAGRLSFVQPDKATVSMHKGEHRVAMATDRGGESPLRELGQRLSALTQT